MISHTDVVVNTYMYTFSHVRQHTLTHMTDTLLVMYVRHPNIILFNISISCVEGAGRGSIGEIERLPPPNQQQKQQEKKKTMMKMEEQNEQEKKHTK